MWLFFVIGPKVPICNEVHHYFVYQSLKNVYIIHALLFVW